MSLTLLYTFASWTNLYLLLDWRLNSHAAVVNYSEEAEKFFAILSNNLTYIRVITYSHFHMIQSF
jgi:hypothetical protein